jgi:hypothetical protein
MRWPTLVATLACALVLGTRHAGAKSCGDDVNGQDVPCACGDTVVSNLALAGDPVLDAPCPTDGLLVRVADTRPGVTIDFRGEKLRGQGQGTGLWVLDGGQGGARVISSGAPGGIEGFNDGLFAKGNDSVALVENVAVADNHRDGVRIVADGYELRNSTARNSGRDGFATMGNDFRVTGTRAERSGRAGYWVMGMNAQLGAPDGPVVTADSGYHGFFLMGWGIVVSNCEASGAKEDGVHLSGMHIEVHDCVVTENGDDGIGTGGGGAWSLSGNKATDNDGNGILIYGPYDPLTGAYNADGGGNSGAGNRGLRQSRPAVQCEISGRPCEGGGWW